MKNLLILSMFFLLVVAAAAFAAPQREAAWIDAPPIVAYGKDSSGNLQPILVASDGTMQTA